MIRKTILITFILVIFLSASPSRAYMQDNTLPLNSFEIARETFSVSGAELGEIKLQAWGQITNRKHSTEHLKEIFSTITAGLGLFEIRPVIQIEKNAFISISFLESGAKEEFQLVLQSVPETPVTGTSFLGFLLITQDIEKAGRVYYLLLPLLKEIGYTDELGITISGIRQEEISFTQQSGIIQQMALSSNARFVEGIKGDLISNAYYTPRLSSSLSVNGKKINLQLACRSYPDEKTKFYVGIPMIYQEY